MVDKWKGKNEDRQNADQLQIGQSLPPRIVKHASKKTKLVRYYSIALVWIFFLLTIMLIVWGYHNS